MKDIGNIELGQTAEIELLHPKTLDGLGAFFVLAGPEHPVRRSIDLAVARRLRTEYQKRRSIDLGDPEDDVRRDLDYLVASTLGWYSLDKETGERKDNVILLDGNWVAFSVEAVRKIYDAPERAWIRKQIRQDLRSDEVFLTGSSQTSSGTPSGTSASSA